MSIDLHDCQTTLRGRAALSGVGVHGGKPVTLALTPADPDTGIVFQRTDEHGETVDLRALVSEVGSTDLCTVLGDPSGLHVGTIEHLVAALSMMGVDNAIVEIDGPEVPIMDGSASMFVDLIDEAGIEYQAVKRRYIRVIKPVRIEIGPSWAEFRPYDGTRFEVEIDFESSAIGRQVFSRDVNAQVFRTDISRARTFGFMKDVERLWAAGFALGSSLENSVVVSEDGAIINVEGLRYADEFVRHKTLDAIGDLALAGARFIGCFRSYRGGHKLNAAALSRLLSDRSAYEIVEAKRPTRGRSAELVTVSTAVFAPWTL